ncbi:hypothetical protein KCU93_g10152, partial [Aureobasidium melanogenum]
MFARLSLIALALAFFLNLTTALPHFGWYPRPTAAFPHPTGGFPHPTGAWPHPTGGFPVPTGGFNPFPTGFPTGFPPGWVPGEAHAPTGTVPKSIEKRFEGARGNHDGFWWGNWGNWGPKPTASAPVPTGAWPTAPIPVPTGW